MRSSGIIGQLSRDENAGGVCPDVFNEIPWLIALPELRVQIERIAFIDQQEVQIIMAASFYSHNTELWATFA